MKILITKAMCFLGLLAMGATAALGFQTGQPQMNGKLKVTTLAPEETCYTGKPYNKELGAYVFNARNYDPVATRWTTTDPSGFPDGANNHAYMPVPTSQFDPNGLDTYPTYTYIYSLYVFAQQKGPSAGELTFTTSTQVASLATTGAVSQVISAIGTLGSGIPHTNDSWTILQADPLGAWSGEAPPQGAQYHNLTVTSSVSLSKQTVFYKNDDPDMTGPFFAPIENSVLSSYNAQKPGDKATVIPPEVWQDQAPDNTAYPGDPASISARYTTLIANVTITLE